MKCNIIPRMRVRGLLVIYFSFGSRLLTILTHNWFSHKTEKERKNKKQNKIKRALKFKNFDKLYFKGASKKKKKKDRIAFK